MRRVLSAGRSLRVAAARWSRARPMRRRPNRAQAALLGVRQHPSRLLLEELDARRLLLIGAATEGCIAQTAIDARELGFKVTILADACATNDENLEQIALHYAEQVVGVRIERGADDKSRRVAQRRIGASDRRLTRLRGAQVRALVRR